MGVCRRVLYDNKKQKVQEVGTYILIAVSPVDYNVDFTKHGKFLICMILRVGEISTPYLWHPLPSFRPTIQQQPFNMFSWYVMSSR